MFRALLPVLAIAAVVTACGDDANSDAPDGGATGDGGQTGADGSTSTPPADKPIVTGFSAPALAQNLAKSSASLGAQAAFLASQLGAGGAQLVTTGTLRQTAQGSSTFNYEATPNDRLRLQYADGTFADFFIMQMQGDFSRDAEFFLSNDHVFALRAVQDGLLDFTINSQAGGGTSSGSAQGSMVLEGVSYTVSLQTGGQVTSDISGTSARYDTTDQLQGTITADGFSENIAESYVYKSIAGDNFVQNVTRQAQSTWTAGGSSFALTNVTIKQAFSNGFAAEPSFWLAEGVLTQDGAPIGQLSLQLGQTAFEIYLSLSDRQILLESHAAKQ